MYNQNLIQQIEEIIKLNLNHKIRISYNLKGYIVGYKYWNEYNLIDIVLRVDEYNRITYNSLLHNGFKLFNEQILAYYHIYEVGDLKKLKQIYRDAKLMQF